MFLLLPNNLCVLKWALLEESRNWSFWAGTTFVATMHDWIQCIHCKVWCRHMWEGSFPFGVIIWKISRIETTNLIYSHSYTCHYQEWVGILPWMPTHYRMPSTTETYVECTFPSVLHMYSVYLLWCEENNISTDSRTFSVQIFREERIAIYLLWKNHV